MIENHKVNKTCDCTKCFVKSIMDESGESYEQIIKLLLKMQDEGILTIDDYDAEGFPLSIKRIAPIKKIKEMLADIDE